MSDRDPDTADVTTDLVELSKRRGFFFASNGAYGGVAGFYTYGPEGAALKRNVEAAWRDRFVVREGHDEVESPTVMPEAVFDASGHLDTFDDMLVECPECGESHRADHLVEGATDVEDAESLPGEEVAEIIAAEDIQCPTCGAALSGQPVEDFNLMFETAIGPGDGSRGFLRPETAQGIFVEFPRLSEYARKQLPFGVAQIGPGYRNEISPRRSIIRVREFTMAELELFYDPERNEPDLSRVADVPLSLYPVSEQTADGGSHVETTVAEAVDEGLVENAWIALYLGLARRWFERVGVDMDRFRFRQHLPGERAHYAVDCWDAETYLGDDWVEVAGFAYRGDYDLHKHDVHSDDDFTVFRQYDEPKSVERATVDPDMSYLGPEFGDRAGEVADALADLAATDRSAFEGETVAVEVGDGGDGEAGEGDGEGGDRDGESGDVNTETVTVPTEVTGFSVSEQTESGEHLTPHVVEPSFGVGRVVYSVLEHAYREDEVDGERRTYLALPPAVAPTFVGVFPLMDKDGLGERARELAGDLRAAGFEVAYDDSGNIGRRYRRQDEVGTPYCATVDYDTEADDTVTVRERDTTDQVRVPAEDLPETLAALRAGDLSFGEL